VSGIGVDVLSIARMEETLSRTGNRFLDKVFSLREQAAGKAHPNPTVYFATRFAAKEAVFKLFKEDWSRDGSFTDIEVDCGVHGEPLVHLTGPLRELAGPDACIQISLSWDGDVAFAVALLV
jgi:holo-[acyl-carrier protein] synthase